MLTRGRRHRSRAPSPAKARLRVAGEAVPRRGAGGGGGGLLAPEALLDLQLAEGDGRRGPHWPSPPSGYGAEAAQRLQSSLAPLLQDLILQRLQRRPLLLHLPGSRLP